MVPLHPLLTLYRGFWFCAQPLVAPWLNWRVRRGKEDHTRLAERRGYASRERPAGKLVWMHGASVGEALALLPLVSRMLALGQSVLVTTGTVSSARLLAKRLPARVIHQYVPLDAPGFVARFLDQWRPNLILLAESELWPNILIAAEQRTIAVALVNARMSQRSFARWSQMRSLAGALLSRIRVCLAQTPQDAARLTSLGAQQVEVCGNLKYDAGALPDNAPARATLQEWIAGRPLWIAASTYEGEEDVLLDVHTQLTGKFPHLLTILAPRHPAGATAILEKAARLGLPAARRSCGEVITSDTRIYVCDTIGDLGLIYRLGGPVFLGKSLVGSGGQNPIEAALLGNVIIHGPAVSNFAEVYRLLDAEGGALCVNDGPALQAQLAILLNDDALCARLRAQAAQVVGGQSGATDRIMQALLPYLAAEPGGSAA